MKSSVFFVSESFFPAIHGSTTQVRQLGRGLTDVGHKVSVVTRLINDSDPREVTLDGIHVIRVGTARGTSRFGKFLMIPAMLGTLFRRRKEFDTLILSAIDVLGPICIIFCRIFRKTCILRPASCGEMDGSNHYVYDKEFKPLKRRLIRLIVWLRNGILRRGDLYLSISSAITPELIRCGVPERKIVRFGNGINLHQFRPATIEQQAARRRSVKLPDAYIFMYCGRIAHGKGLLQLLEAWRQHDRLNPDSCLVLVGSCQGFSMDCELELRRAVQNYGLGDRILFTGAVENVHHYLQAADVFVFPTEWEALGNSAIEAIACGLPIIGSDVGGVPDIVHDGENGFLVPVGNIDALTMAMGTIRDDRALASKYAKCSRRIAMDFFDLEKKRLRLSTIIEGWDEDTRCENVAG